LAVKLDLSFRWIDAVNYEVNPQLYTTIQTSTTFSNEAADEAITTTLNGAH